MSGRNQSRNGSGATTALWPYAQTAVPCAKERAGCYRLISAPLPLELLKDVPQAVIVLLEKLLQKDPAERFRTPNELLNAIPTEGQDSWSGKICTIRDI